MAHSKSPVCSEPLSRTFLSPRSQTSLGRAENKAQLCRKRVVLTGAIWPGPIAPVPLPRLPTLNHAVSQRLNHPGGLVPLQSD